MTNPIDPTSESNESAAQYRVSAQELSHVVGIIQARKEAEARQRANTVALGEAVEQLGLEMTPDELLAEIRADRARRSGSARPKRSQNPQRHAYATFAVCAGLAAMMVSSVHMHRMNRAMWESRNSPLFMTRDFAADTVSPSPTFLETQPVTEELSQPMMTTSEPAQFRPFSQFGENEAADCDLDAVRAMANGKSTDSVLVQPNGTGEDSLWTLFKKDGDVLVYAFGTSEELAKAVNGRAAHLYASQHDGLEQELLPLRLFKNAQLVDTPGYAGADLNPEVPEIPIGQRMNFRVYASPRYENGVKNATLEVTTENR